MRYFISVYTPKAAKTQNTASTLPLTNHKLALFGFVIVSPHFTLFIPHYLKPFIVYI